MSESTALLHAIELIRRESVTPEDGGCQDYLESILAPLGFERTQVNTGGITNSIYARPGERNGTLAFAGHTDVVPPGEPHEWQTPPFTPEIRNGVLHGRGAQDMKSAIACWASAIESLAVSGTPLPALQLLITSDEEGESVDGTVRIIEHMQAANVLPDAAIVGEPSCSEKVGDSVRRGRRGIALVTIEFHGRQGHSAYADNTENAIHLAAPVLTKIAAIDWGEPADGFPPTTCQVTNLYAGTGATNVIPGSCNAVVDIRFNPANGFDDIRRRINQACADSKVDIHFHNQGDVFSTPDGSLLDLVSDSIRRITGLETLMNTGGGTSDGRFLATAGVPVVEIGLTNSTIHQVNERVALHELDTLTRIYADIIEHFEV